MQMNYHLHGAFTLTHCLPVLSRIRDKSGYTESQIIPNYMNYRSPFLVSPLLILQFSRKQMAMDKEMR